MARKHVMLWSKYKRIRDSRRHSKAMRAGGMRRIQIWVPDTNRPDFEEICREQVRSVAEANKKDQWLYRWMNATLADTEDSK